MKKLSIILLAVMMIFTSCSPDVSGTGSISVSVNKGVRGIGGFSEDCIYYVSVTSNTVSDKFESRINADQKATFNNVPVGEWTVTVVAKVKNTGTRMGSGSSVCQVVKGETVPCVVNLTADGQPGEGNGIIRLHFSHIPDDLTVKFYTVSEKNGVVTETLVKEKSLNNGSWYIEDEISLPGGYYILRLESYETVILDETVYIRSNERISFTRELRPVDKPTGGIDVTINDDISGFPRIAFSGVGRSVLPGAEFSITASVSGMTEPVWTWLINSVPVEGANTSTLTAVAPLDGSRLEITARAVSGNKVWSETKEMSVTDNMFEGKWIAQSISNTNFSELYVMEMHDGHMVYDRYGAGGRAMKGLESDYTVIQKDSAYIIDFNWFSHDYHFNVDPSTESAVLHFAPNDNGGACRMSFKRYTVEPEFTRMIKECGADYHCEVLIHPELGEFIDDDVVRKPHTFVNGVCSVCGFDLNKNIYEICSDPSWIGEEQITSVDVVRYWPGILTKCDGTVINDTNHFYYRKWEDGRYVIYMPHTISDFYIENGGSYGYSAHHILSWFIETKSNGLNFYDNTYNEVLAWLFANEDQISNLDATTISHASNSREVTTVLPEFTIRNINTSGYTQNDLRLEDGTPITSCDRFYIYYDKSEASGHVSFIYPLCVQEAYEKADGCNPGSGNPYYEYVHTYYPELNARDYDSVVRTLMTEPFKVPDYRDYNTNDYNR